MADLFPETGVSIEQQIAEINRELGQRRHVYPRLVATGKLTQRRADQQTQALEAVLKTLIDLKSARGNAP